MPLYVVRWTDLSVSMVHAYSEDELVDRLDEIGDPGAARWEIYEGPIWFEFEPLTKVRLEAEAAEGVEETRARYARLHVNDLTLEGVDRFEPEGSSSQFLHATSSGSETETEMRQAIVDRMFPHLAEALMAGPESTSDEEYEAAVATAVRKELAPMLQYQWRAARVKDPILYMAGLTEPLPYMKRGDGPENDQERVSWQRPGAVRDVRQAMEFVRALARRLQCARDALSRVRTARQGTCSPEEVTERLRGIAARAMEDDDEADFNMVEELGRGHSAFCRGGDGPEDDDDLVSFTPTEEMLVSDRLGAVWRLEPANEYGDHFRFHLVKPPPIRTANEVGARAKVVGHELSIEHDGGQPDPR